MSKRVVPTDIQREPAFLSLCEVCGCQIRYVHDRPYQHDPATCQHNIETKEACPWRA